MRVGRVSATAARATLALLTTAVAIVACGGEDDASTPSPATSGETAAVTSGGAPGSDGTAAIVVETPAAHATVTSPVTVAGTADVFEANVTVVVLDQDGNELARDFTTATCGTGCRGDYSLELPFAVQAEQPGTIVVQDDDAAGDGTPPHVARVAVTLAPS